MGEYKMYVLLTGAPFTTRAKVYMKARNDHRDAAFNQVMKLDKDAKVSFGLNGHIFGVVFSDESKRPPNWKLVNAKHRGYAPRDKSPDIEWWNALPKIPNVFGFVFPAEDFPTCIGYTSKEGSGSWLPGPFFGASLGWTDELQFVAVLTDVNAAIAHRRKETPKAKIEVDGKPVPKTYKWALPKGLKQITEAEKELIFAEARVRSEKKSKNKRKSA